MTDKETMKLALEALEYHTSQTRPIYQTDIAITALKERLAQPEQEPVAHLWECLGRWSAYLVDNGAQADCSPPSWLVDAVKNATTPQPQEFVCSTGLCHFTLTQTNVGIGERGMEAYEAAKERGWVGLSDERLMEMPEQEPVGYVYSELGVKSAAIQIDLPNGTPLYTHPPQRTWVGLTDEEVSAIISKVIGFNSCVGWEEDYARAIEAKLKEKNT